MTAKDRHGVRGLRVSPHYYNTERDIDEFVAALVEVCDAKDEDRHAQQPAL